MSTLQSVRKTFSGQDLINICMNPSVNNIEVGRFITGLFGATSGQDVEIVAATLTNLSNTGTMLGLNLKSGMNTEMTLQTSGPPYTIRDAFILPSGDLDLTMQPLFGGPVASSIVTTDTYTLTLTGAIVGSNLSANLDTQVASLSSAVSSQGTSLSSLATTVGGLSSSLSSQSSSISSINSSISGINSTMTSLGTSMSGLTTSKGVANRIASLDSGGKVPSSQLPASGTRSYSNPTRTLNNAFQPSTTQDALVSYSVDVSTSVSLSGGAVGTVYLEYADNNTFTTNLKEVGRFVNGNTGTLVVGLTLNQTATGTLTGIVPAGKYTRIRTDNTTGTPTFNYRSGQEVLL